MVFLKFLNILLEEFLELTNCYELNKIFNIVSFF